MIADLELIRQATEKQDSGALTELVNRHSGAYLDVVQQYASTPSFAAKANIPDLRDERATHIWEWAKSYDPTRGMKFSSYVYDMTRFMCKKIVSTAPESVALDQSEDCGRQVEAPDTPSLEKRSVAEALKERAKQVEDPKFYEIYCARFCGDTIATWRQVARQVKMTPEGARRLFNRHKHKLVYYAKT